MRLATAALLLVACDRRTPVSTCDDNLHGVWMAPGGARWMLLDNGAMLEGYPLFDDSAPGGAPRVIDLRRAARPSDTPLAGEIKRRFMQRADACEARAAIRVIACEADTLEVALADVAPPRSFAPCTWGQAAPPRVETWTRE